MLKMTTFMLCELYHHFLKFKWKKKLLSTCRRWSNDISNWSCQKRLHGEEDIWNEPYKADGLKIDRKGHSRWTEPQEQTHIEKEKKIQTFLSSIAPTLNKHFSNDQTTGACVCNLLLWHLCEARLSCLPPFISSHPASSCLLFSRCLSSVFSTF